MYPPSDLKLGLCTCSPGFALATLKLAPTSEISHADRLLYPLNGASDTWRREAEPVREVTREDRLTAAHGGRARAGEAGGLQELQGGGTGLPGASRRSQHRPSRDGDSVRSLSHRSVRRSVVF